jgi:NTE family protein
MNARKPMHRDQPNCILVLQGGGALGAYHVGAYEALAKHDFHPDWVCGISIGAFNAAVIAGNPREARVKRLGEMWESISWPSVLPPSSNAELHWWQNSLSFAEGLWFGQPNFFRPRPFSPWLVPDGQYAVSFYDTAPMAGTLKQFADFALIDGGATRLSLGVTEITSGELKFFNNFAERRPIEPKDFMKHVRIQPEHVLASGSLPPGFPPIEIGEESYWDGGCISNTPLEAVLRDPPEGHTVAFVIDLWNGRGEVPANMKEVLWREKQIQYASRIATHVDAVATKFELARKNAMLKAATAQLAKGAAGSKARIEGASAKDVAAAIPDEICIGPDARIDIVHIIYQPTPDQTPWSDAEFSRASIAQRRKAGYDHMLAALAQKPWLAPKGPHECALVHCVENGRVVTRTPGAHRTRGERADRPPAAASAGPKGGKLAAAVRS